jgi:hypothetical protein
MNYYTVCSTAVGKLIEKEKLGFDLSLATTLIFIYHFIARYGSIANIHEGLMQ